jgi:ElaB/YqjD/DUF883 family membrane-anchored ribosome-binding protein
MSKTARRPAESRLPSGRSTAREEGEMNQEPTGNPALDETLDDPVAEALADEESESRRMDAIYKKARVARDKLNSVVEDLGVKADQVEQVVRKNVDQTGERIKQNPFAAVGIAAGLGLLVGLLLNRRH